MNEKVTDETGQVPYVVRMQQNQVSNDEINNPIGAAF